MQPGDAPTFCISPLPAPESLHLTFHLGMTANYQSRADNAANHFWS